MCGYDFSHVNSTVSKLHANVLYYMVHTLLEKRHSGQIFCCQEPAFRQDSGIMAQHVRHCRRLEGPLQASQYINTLCRVQRCWCPYQKYTRIKYRDTRNTRNTLEIKYIPVAVSTRNRIHTSDGKQSDSSCCTQYRSQCQHWLGSQTIHGNARNSVRRR